MKLAGRLDRRCGVVALCVALGSVAGVAPAGAAPLTISKDRSDNGYSFTYNATLGRIVTMVSSITERRGDADPVRFTSGVGERVTKEGKTFVVTTFRLKLLASKSVSYDGTFLMKFKERNGGAVVERSKKADFVLRPAPGRRVRRINFVTRPPSGSYDVVARFVSD